MQIGRELRIHYGKPGAVVYIGPSKPYRARQTRIPAEIIAIESAHEVPIQ